MTPPSPDRPPRPLLASRYSVALLTLVGLLVAVTYGIVRTGSAGPPAARSGTTIGADSLPAVDESSLSNAQALVRLPTTSDERPFAEDALRIADKEMDLAFANAVRRLALHPPAMTPAVQAIANRLHQGQDELVTDQEQVAALVADSARATVLEAGTVADRLNLARAHLELVQDEVDDASQDLIRSGGNPKGRMQAMLDEHAARSRSSDSTHVNLMVAVPPRGLVRHLRQWGTLQQKIAQLADARDAAASAAVTFEERHAAVDAGRATHGDSAGATTTHRAAVAQLLDVQREALAQKSRGTLDQHVDDQHHLVEVYQRWSAVVRGQQRAEINGMLRGLAGILGIVLLLLLLDRWLERRLARMSLEQRRTQTAYMVVRVSLQVVAVASILLVAFGTPDNLGTFLGLAGAGLTVALKDFLLGFLGWFVLMGRDGIGIGDLVEINGVTGEVLEVGIFHTVLLETGNWVESGHLTGRRVTFSNSFAIERHYFNFSTSGRWLWDEVRFVVPTGKDVTGIVGALQREVEALTAGTTARMQQEITSSRRAARLTAFTAAPSLYVKPIVGGVEVTVRYLTHVHERAERRARLYEIVIELLGDRPETTPAIAAGAGTAE
jgi:hypothetical protein